MDMEEKGLKENLKGHKNLLVSFGGINQGLGIPVFEFFNSISSLDIDQIFLRDFNQMWYQKGVDDEMDSVEKIVIYLGDLIKKYDRVTFLGNSMGGFGAILFGSLLNVDNIIVFSPQTFIDKNNRLSYGDTRWSSQIKNTQSLGETEFFDLNNILKVNDKSSIHVHYSPSDKLDRIHSERLGVFKNVKLNSYSEGGHSVVKVIKESGGLVDIVINSFS